MTNPMRSQTAKLDTTNTLVSAARFVIQFDGQNSPTNNGLAFSELTGITSEVEVTEYLSSNGSGISLSKQFGKTKPATVTLKRGVDTDLTLWTWHQQVLRGDPAAKKSCSLILLDSAGLQKQSYHLLNAWPQKLDIGNFKAGGSDAAVATVVIVCEQIDVDNHTSPNK